MTDDGIEVGDDRRPTQAVAQDGSAGHVSRSALR
jgi:hypothetical protein